MVAIFYKNKFGYFFYFGSNNFRGFRILQCRLESRYWQTKSTPLPFLYLVVRKNTHLYRLNSKTLRPAVWFELLLSRVTVAAMFFYGSECHLQKFSNLIFWNSLDTPICIWAKTLRNTILRGILNCIIEILKQTTTKNNSLNVNIFS